MIRLAIALLLVLPMSNSAAAPTPVRVMTGYAATSGPHAVLLTLLRQQLEDSGFIKSLYPKG